MSRIIGRLLGLGLVLLATPAMAQIVDSPRAMGMGGAVAGDPMVNSALVYNPAGMARAMVYSAQGQFFRSAPAGLNSVGANVVDSKSQPRLAMGVAYGYVFSDSDAPVTVNGHDVRLGVASPMNARGNLTVGLTLHYLHLDRETNTEATPPSGLASRPLVEDFKRLTADVGLLWSLNETVHVGLVGYNLIETGNPELPRQAGGGLGFTVGQASVDLDLLGDFDSAEKTEMVVRGGMELLLADILPLRGGFILDKAHDRTIATGGVGFMGGVPGSSYQINLAYQQDLDDKDAFEISAGMSFFL